MLALNHKLSDIISIVVRVNQFATFNFMHPPAREEGFVNKLSSWSSKFLIIIV